MREIGVCQVGRDGPIVACAVLPPEHGSDWENKMIYETLVKEVDAYGIRIVLSEKIDDLGRSKANMKAMHMAIGDCLKGQDGGQFSLSVGGSEFYPPYMSKDGIVVNQDNCLAKCGVAQMVAGVLAKGIRDVYFEKKDLSRNGSSVSPLSAC